MVVCRLCLLGNFDVFCFQLVYFCKKDTIFVQLKQTILKFINSGNDEKDF